MEAIDKLASTTLQSHPLTHSRLKLLASMAQTSEDHVSRLGMALSMASGKVDPRWVPRPNDYEKSNIEESSPKHIRGKTLFKDETPLWMALAMRHQSPDSYEDWRGVLKAHWERGVEELMVIATAEGDWIRTLRKCLPN
tara:strand:+ start:322 stop:738 length:417 start_codon:yes stop_codon:yes gene_type:complete